MTVLIDSHVHLDDARFDYDRDQLIKSAQQVGIGRFIVPAVTKAIKPKVIANVTSMKVFLVMTSWKNRPATNVLNIAIHPMVWSNILMKNIHN